MAYPDDYTMTSASVDGSTPRVFNTLAWLRGQLIAALGATTDAASTTTGTITAHLRAIRDALTSANAVLEYETVPASASAQVLGATGAVGDYFEGMLVVPTTTSPGAITIRDGAAGEIITIFAGGILPSVIPFYVPLGFSAATPTNPGWRVTTGLNVTAVPSGNFT